MESKAPLEIERKWMVNGWPEKELPLLFSQRMRQGYVSTHPTVRIREENTITSNDASHPVNDSFVLCIKSSGLLTRKEIEIDIEKEKFVELEDLIGLPLIDKLRNTYLLPDGHHLEVNHVDEGLDSEFWYAEIEFQSEEDAKAFDPSKVSLFDYLNDDVTDQPDQSMAAYWEKTRKTEKR